MATPRSCPSCRVGLPLCAVQYMVMLLKLCGDELLASCCHAGHSLGGALATLAAFDIARACNLSRLDIACYTFGELEELACLLQYVMFI